VYRGPDAGSLVTMFCDRPPSLHRFCSSTIDLQHLISFASNRCTIYVETQGNSISIFKLGAATVPDFMTWIVGQALVSIVEFHYRWCTAGDEFEGSIVHCSSSQILPRAHLRNTHCFIIEKNDSYRYRCNNQSINRKRDGHSIQRNLEIVLPIW
jgi:hypothetical protein